MGTVTYRGLTMGWGRSSRPIMVERITGIDSMSSDAATSWLPRNHQGAPVAGFVRGGDIDLELRIIDDNPGSRADIASAFSPDPDDRTAEDEMVFALDDGEEWSTFVRCANRIAVRDRQNENSGPRVLCQMVRSDPVKYGAGTTVTLTPFAGTEFADYPGDGLDPADWGDYPKLYSSGGSGGGVTVDNDGNWPTWPRFVIEGPTAGTMQLTSLENATTGDIIRFTDDGGLSIPSGSTLVVDMHPARRVVQFTTGASRLNHVSDLSAWWQVEPGSNELRLRASGDTDGASAEAQVRSGWL